MKDLYLIDASIYVFRAWFSLPDTLTGEKGQPVNAVYGFIRFLIEFLERTQASHVALAFDESLSTSFRNEMFPEYKANRDPAPPELKTQFEACKRFAIASGCACFSHERYEADDLIATLAARMREAGFRNYVVTADKDLAQVIEENDMWWDFHRNQTLSHSGVKEKFGVSPEQLRDYFGLVGDAVDNIPGVPGIGPKSATKLLWLFKDLEGIYDNIDQVAQMAMRGAARVSTSLREHKDQAFLCRELATVKRDIPLQVGGEQLRRSEPDWVELSGLVAELGRGEGYVQRLRSLIPST